MIAAALLILPLTSACSQERTAMFSSVLQSLTDTTRSLPHPTASNLDLISPVWGCQNKATFGQRVFCAAQLLPGNCTMAVTGMPRDAEPPTAPCSAIQWGTKDFEHGLLQGVDILEASSRTWTRNQVFPKLCLKGNFAPRLLLLHLPARKLPPADELAIWAAGCKMMLYDRRLSEGEAGKVAILGFISWEWAHRDFDAKHSCEDAQPRRFQEPFSKFLESTRDICPASAPPVCSDNPAYMPAQSKRLMLDLPQGCPIIPDTMPRAGFGNHLGLMFSYAALGRLLQRPVVIYLFENGDPCMNKHGFANLMNLSTLARSWGGLHYLEKDDHDRAFKAAPDSNRLVFPPFDRWPDPRHSVDLLSEPSYILFRKTGFLTRFPSSARLWRCLSPERWTWQFEQAGRAFKLRVDLGLPPPKKYIVLYLRRMDKGDIGPTRTALLKATLGEIASAIHSMQLDLPWIVLSFDSRHREAMTAVLRSHNVSLHPFTMTDAEKAARKIEEYDYTAVRLMQDFFLMARAAGLLSSCPWGNPTYSTGAHWATGGHLPYFSADPRPPEGQNWQHQQLALPTFPGGMRKWWFYPQYRPFLEAVKKYAQARQ